MKDSKTRDVYDMSNNFIKATISEILFPLTHPLTHVINFCIKDVIFPEQLKVSKVCPIYKKGDKNNPASYRPTCQ